MLHTVTSAQIVCSRTKVPPPTDLSDVEPGRDGSAPRRAWTAEQPLPSVPSSHAERALVTCLFTIGSSHDLTQVKVLLH
eukprot:847930-Amphidinium_carterae.1